MNKANDLKNALLALFRSGADWSATIFVESENAPKV